MAYTPKQLAQARPSGTSAVSIYSPGADITTTINTITLVNNTSSAIVVKVYLDNDGTTYSAATQITSALTIDADAMVSITSIHYMNNSSGNLAVETDTANALTVTVDGVEVG